MQSVGLPLGLVQKLQPAQNGTVHLLIIAKKRTLYSSSKATVQAANLLLAQYKVSGFIFKAHTGMPQGSGSQGPF